MNSTQKNLMTLKQLLNGFVSESLDINHDTGVKGISYDSRNIKPGYLFVALKGREMDGHDYIQDAIKRGAIAVVSEQDSADVVDKNIPFFR